MEDDNKRMPESATRSELEALRADIGPYLALKRAMDLTAGALLLLVLAPVLAAVAVLVRLSHGSPVIFKQLRPGRDERPFTLYKFRTMSEAHDAEGQPLPDAMRLTRFGRLLRRSSLDELPELVNVVRGDMSLVGPRPLLMQYLPLYTRRHRRRHAVRPGLTGLAQVRGRNSADWRSRLDLDVEYVENTSLALDLSILLRTVPIALSGRGVSQPGEATVQPFTGSDPQK